MYLRSLGLLGAGCDDVGASPSTLSNGLAILARMSSAFSSSSLRQNWPSAAASRNTQSQGLSGLKGCEPPAAMACANAVAPARLVLVRSSERARTSVW